MTRKRKYTSMRGAAINMDELRVKHEKTVAAGNMKVNARGDRLGKAGEVVETAQQKAMPYYKGTRTAVQRASIKPPVSKQETAATSGATINEEEATVRSETAKVQHEDTKVDSTAGQENDAKADSETVSESKQSTKPEKASKSKKAPKNEIELPDGSIKMVSLDEDSE